MLLSDVCLSVAYIGPNSRTERPRKTKIGTEVAHVTLDSDTTFKVKGQLVADVLNSQHAGTGATWRINTKILLCRNSTATWRINAKILSTCSERRHIVSPRAQLVVFSQYFRRLNFLLCDIPSPLWYCWKLGARKGIPQSHTSSRERLCRRQ